jgi:electron transport complex protein RnfC
MLPTFPGGMHVHDGKELTKDRAVKTAPVPSLVIVPLSQHIGAPCEAIVKKKDVVLRGQPVGEAKGFVSAPVHSPVSGTVRDVVAAPHASGGKVLSVLIENDGRDELFPGVDVETDPGTLSRDQMVERVKAAGIVGLGGATFPAHVKLSPPKDKPIDTVIVNGAECEPLLTCDYRLMMESPQTVVRGGDLVRRLVGAKHLILATEDNKRDAAEVLSKAISDLKIADARVAVAKTRYPQGGERQLIKALLGREVPTPRRRGLPMDVGVIVQNVGTCHAIFGAITRNLPLIERLVTVVGDAVAEPGNFRVRIGTPVRALLEATGFRTDPEAILLGGPMMGAAVYTPDVPVTKGTSGILVLSSVAESEPRDCIRCGSCVKVCPARLTPLDLSLADEAKRYDLAEEWHVDDCIECGCCSFICPAHRPIVQQIRHAKAALRRSRAAVKAG